jgi:hypothetical protein
MHTGRAFVTLLLVATLLTLLTTCNMNLAVPSYSLEFRGTTAYPAPVTATVQFKYSAEDNVQRCRYVLTNSAGIELDSGTCSVPADRWQTHECDLPAEDRYTFRVVVQVQKASGEFVDLSFLDKSVNLYVDESPPDEPQFTLATGVYTTNQYTELLHDELTTPEGSPVVLYYKLNGSPLDPDKIRNTGAPILVPVSATTQQLNAVAVDEAGNEGPIASIDYNFMGVTAVVNLSAGGDPPGSGRVGAIPPVEIHGFGFNATVAVQLADVDGTVAEIFSGPNFSSDTLVTISPKLLAATGTGGSDPGIDPGEGQIRVKLTSPATDWVSIPFTVLP